MAVMANGLLPILILFVAHWQISIFFQTFFLHRYGAHKQFFMSKGWERFFHLCTYLTQGSSFLSPRGYAIMHRMHHAYSDTPKDPHSPTNFSNVLTMMWTTKHTYDDYAYDRVQPEPRFLGGYPEWKALDRLGQNWGMRIFWIAAYSTLYVHFASAWWMYLFLPAHFVMGPIHGAIVNWCGHKYGYRNFANGDDSKNTLVFDFLTFGELFQNNHHKFSMSPNFAARWFEVDPAYVMIRIFAKLGIIQLGPQTIRWEPGTRKPNPPAASKAV